MTTTNIDPVGSFISRWQGREGGQERANDALFVSELCRVHEGQPGPAAPSSDKIGDVFELAVREPNGDGTFRKRGSLLEAKRSCQMDGKKELTGETDNVYR